MSRNIGGDINDVSYRYKVPIPKIEHKNRKTKITNLSEIANAIKRNPDYISKYFGCELSTVYKYKNDECIINGNHSRQVLDKILDDFINKWVLCSNCELPETDLLVRKNKIYFDCKACGNHSKCNYNHKLAKFILKNLPNDIYKQRADEPI